MTRGDAPLRILLVNRALPEHAAGGLERHVADLAEGLAERGCDVHLLAASTDDATRRKWAGRGIALHMNSAAAPRRYSLDYMLKTPAIARELAKEIGAKIIHGQEFSLGKWGRRAGDPAVILTVHGTITSETPLHEDAWPLLSPAQKTRALARYGRRHLFAPAWRRTLHDADALLVDSAFTRGEMLKEDAALEEKIRLVPLGVREETKGGAAPDRESARRALGWEGPQILTLGRLEWAKGHAAALRALALMKDLSWNYTIAGEGSERATLGNLARELGLEARVVLAGRVEETTKRAMLAGADLGLWPEIAHPAFGLFGLECLLHGTPVVATRRGAIPEVLGARGGWIVAQPDPALLTQALRAALEDPAALAARREVLRADALERMSFDAMIDGVLGVYRTALSR